MRRLVLFFGFPGCVLAFAQVLLAPIPARAVCAPAVIRVHGSSLAPLLRDGAEVEGYKGSVQDCGAPARGDLALVKAFSPASPTLVKIVSGVPGDHFSLLRDGAIWRLKINGTVARNSAHVAYGFNDGRARMLKLYEADDHGIIPPQTYLLLGDNAEGTQDSSRFGLVGAGDLEGWAARPHGP